MTATAVCIGYFFFIDKLKHCDQGNLQKDLFGRMVPEGTSPLWQKGIAARRMLARTQAKSSHLDLQAGSRERELRMACIFLLSEPASCDMLSLTRPCFLGLLKQCYQLGGHVFKFWKLWRTLHSNHHTDLLEDQEFGSQHPGRATHNYLLTPAPPDPTPLTSTSSHARADTHRQINKNKRKKTAVSKYMID